MADQTIKWVDSQATRAPRIPAALWTQHKDQIEDLYERMTLDDLMKFMKIQHGFAPSSRQYVFQLEKWGIQKYRKVPVAVPSASEITSAAPMARETCFHAPPDLITPNGKRKISPPVPPKKRQKLDAYMLAKAAPPLSFHPFNTCVPRTDDTASSAVSVIMEGETRMDAEQSWLDNSSSIESVDTDDHIDETFKILHSKHGDVSNPPNVEEDVNPGVSELYRSWVVQVDASTPVHLLDMDRINDIILAADFMHAVGLDADAFSLYALLAKRHHVERDLSHWIVLSALMGCANSSTSALQHEIAINLLLHNLEDDVDTLTDARLFLYRSLVSELYRKSGNPDTALFYDALTESSAFIRHKSITRLDERDRCISLQICHSLHRQLAVKGHFVSASRLKPQFADMHTTLPAITGQPCWTSTLRGCVDWCMNKLRNKSLICLGTWAYTSDELQLSDFFRVYGALFIAWVREREWNTPTTNWARDSPKYWQMSPAKVLAIVCKMIRNQISIGVDVKEQWSLSPDKRHYNLIYQSALQGANAVQTLSDKEFCVNFIDAYFHLHLRSHRKGHWSHGDHDAVTLHATKNYIEKVLRIRLPYLSDIDKSELEALSTTIPNRLRPQESVQIYPTLAPSLHSSDYSFLRATGQRTVQNLQEQIVEASMLLPSTVLRNSSRSAIESLQINELINSSQISFGSLSLRDVGNLAQDTVDDISTHVVESALKFEGIVRGHHRQLIID